MNQVTSAPRCRRCIETGSACYHEETVHDRDLRLGTCLRCDRYQSQHDRASIICPVWVNPA